MSIVSLRLVIECERGRSYLQDYILFGPRTASMNFISKQKSSMGK